MSHKVIKKILKIQGMTCSNCERRIENALVKSDGIVEVTASYSRSDITIVFKVNEDIENNKEKSNLDKSIESIEEMGYKVLHVIAEYPDKQNSSEKNTSEENTNGEKVKGDKIQVNQLIGIGVILFALYFIIDRTIGFNFIPKITPQMGYGLLFVIGLMTSIHCVAMCGGINLSQCVSYSKGVSYQNGIEVSDQLNNKISEQKDMKLSGLTKIKPSLLYNAGRVLSYTIIGGIVGAIGSVISFSGYTKGIVAIIAGVFMIIMGLNMLNIFPWLRKLNPKMPRILGNVIGKSKNNKGPFYVGLLNGLMPCGPLQSMQLYALGTGSFVAGATAMLLFSLGTVPLMFGFGAVSSLLSSRFTHKLMKFSAALVIVLGIIMMNRGLSLSGVNIAYASTPAGNIAIMNGNVQIVKTTVTSNSYEPFVVQKGIPVKWIINVDKTDLNGCNNALTVPKYNIQKKLVPGENIVEFTPEEEGKITYTCWMGMIRSNITVVSDLNNVTQQQVYSKDSVDSQNELLGGGNCSTNSSEEFANGKIPVDQLAIGEIKDGTQYVSINVNDYGFSPAVIVIQKNVPTQWILNGEKLNSCNYRLQFPEYNSKIELNEGENLIKFTPSQDFYFSCWMNMINGYVKVVEDIQNINIEEIKKEIEQFELPEGVGGCCG